MPIGKNAIKRVENNGYSKVKTDAPDMVNSTVIGATDEQVMNMVEKEVQKQVETPIKEEPVEVKAPEVKAPAKKPTTKKAKKPATKKQDKVGATYAFGDELPIYLL